MNFDWYKLFVPHEPIGELVLRGSVMYLTLFLLLRVIVRRRVGALSMTDLLVIVLIADAAQNGMAGEYKSITEGVVLCATVIGWSLLLDWLAFHVPFLRDWLEPPSRVLVQNGRLQRRHMREELITEDELMSQLRQHGIERVQDVRRAYVESDGQISVIKKAASSGTDAAHSGKKKAQV
jgi:uncharacterized membrane protein YcaP (DUF421 family)